MISNPVTFFVNGFDTVSFTYEGGSTLYHFSPYDNKLSKSLGCNVVFFANSEEHALDVLKRMLTFSIEALQAYLRYKQEHKELMQRAESSITNFQKYLAALTAGKVKLSTAPMNQFFVIGWAGNDTI